MTLPNFDNQLSQRVSLCKPLEELLSSYFLLDPTVKFVANHRSRRYNDGNFSDDERPIGSVYAYKDSQHLGFVRVSKEDYRNFGNTDIYRVGSDMIHKVRGRNRNERTTKDAHKAIKYMLEGFKPKLISAFQEKILGSVSNKINGMLSAARHRASSLIPMKVNVDIELYLLAQYEGLASALPDSVKEIFATSKENLQKFRDLRIAEGVGKEYKEGGAVVVVFSDGSMWYANKSEVSGITKIATTYDLPKNYQEKLMLLKLCEHSQPVEHVGVKFSDEVENDSNALLYYLVGGETVTTC